ncbi:hypothetical protein KP509_26G043900 [Ceratopteris richardii]|uniref:Uncharacterized protein n=1 Tax=Ceratopteris richardii TaxID=49495 RepID=A0A8T2RMI1_CERRI|nr:hypothetical protein KP509_26G043900 [Ceratopteris richardii]KAH7296897.1 hypothetical protein KP509_26G043900 [Ceratopteris richardii]
MTGCNSFCNVVHNQMSEEDNFFVEANYKNQWASLKPYDEGLKDSSEHRHTGKEDMLHDQLSLAYKYHGSKLSDKKTCSDEAHECQERKGRQGPGYGERENRATRRIMQHGFGNGEQENEVSEFSDGGHLYGKDKIDGIRNNAGVHSSAEEAEKDDTYKHAHAAEDQTTLLKENSDFDGGRERMINPTQSVDIYGTHGNEEKEKSASKVSELLQRVEEKGGDVDYVHRGQWLRAAILGANDGLVSTASLMMGVGAVKDDDAKAMVVSGLAGLVGGACSMAIGEFISVYSQRDAERFDKKQKTKALEKRRQLDEERERQQRRRFAEENPKSSSDLEEGELLTLRKLLAKDATPEVGVENGALKDVNASHERWKGPTQLDKVDVKVVTEEEEEDPSGGPNPWEAAGASGLAFAVGAMVPILAAGFLQSHAMRIGVMMTVCSFALVCMGGLGAKLSAGSVVRGCVRVLLGGWAAMLLTYGLLRLFGTSGV